MAYCHICETECVDITRHLFSCHTQPGATNPSTAAGAPNEIEPSEAEDEETFCYQCSREFQTAAALAAHLGDAQVHFRFTGNRANVPLGRAGHSSYHATGLQVLRPRSSRLSENLDPNYESNDASALPHTLQDDQSSLYTNSTHLSSEDSSDELASEDDESDDVPMDTEYDVQMRTHTGAILGPPGPVAGDAQAPHPPYAPGAYVFTSPSTAGPSGANAYAQEGISMSHSRPQSELTLGMSNYYHRSEATRLDVETEDSSHASQTQGASAPRGHGIMCPICLELAENVTSTLCGHVFCGSCIHLALSVREACPVCNRPTGRWTPHPIYPVF